MITPKTKPLTDMAIASPSLCIRTALLKCKTKAVAFLSIFMAIETKPAGSATRLRVDGTWCQTLVVRSLGSELSDRCLAELIDLPIPLAVVLHVQGMTQLGVPYVWGGTTPGVGFDCSGLTQWCYAQAGIPIPRVTEDQMAAGTCVPLSEARPGDILWRSGHVAVYLGGNSYIHAPRPGDHVRVAEGISRFTCAVRF